jgi:hypothetical protein
MVKSVADCKQDAVELGLLAVFTTNSQSSLGLLVRVGTPEITLAKGLFRAAARVESVAPGR